MLVLTRRKSEQISVYGPCTVTVLGSKGDKVRLGIEADRDTLILRTELEQPPATGGEGE